MINIEREWRDCKTKEDCENFIKSKQCPMINHRRCPKWECWDKQIERKENKRCILWLHKWTKWETYIVRGTIQRHPFSSEMIPYSEKRQKRVCKQCGLEQDREVC